MKYTTQQHEVAKKFREFYYKEINSGNYLEDGWWERMGEDTWNRWTLLYQTGEGFLTQEKAAGDRARKLTKEFFFPKVKKYIEFYFYDGLAFWESLHDENKDAWIGTYLRAEHGTQKEQETFRKTEKFFAAKEIKVKTPSSYTFVSTNEDVDLLRIIREAPAGSPFILIEKKNRTSNETDTFLLVHESILKNLSLKRLTLYGLPIEPDWGVDYLGHFSTRISGTEYQGHFISDRPTSKLRAEIEAVIKALNPKDTKTTVTLW